MYQGDVIKNILKDRGITQEDLASRMNISRSSLLGELRKEPLRIVFLQKFSDAIGFDFDSLTHYIKSKSLPLNINEIKIELEHLKDKLKQQEELIRKSDRLAQLERETRERLEKELEKERGERLKLMQEYIQGKRDS